MEKSETAMVSKRKHWVDVVRGMCMTAILYDHTDIYYSDSNIIPYELYVPNALTAFFILSGYLMYKRSGFCLKNKIRSIMKGLLLPYLIFTIAMALPKSLAHGLSFNIADMHQCVIGKGFVVCGGAVLRRNAVQHRHTADERQDHSAVGGGNHRAYRFHSYALCGRATFPLAG